MPNWRQIADWVVPPSWSWVHLMHKTLNHHATSTTSIYPNFSRTMHLSLKLDAFEHWLVISKNYLPDWHYMKKNWWLILLHFSSAFSLEWQRNAKEWGMLKSSHMWSHVQWSDIHVVQRMLLVNFSLWLLKHEDLPFMPHWFITQNKWIVLVY